MSEKTQSICEIQFIPDIQKTKRISDVSIFLTAFWKEKMPMQCCLSTCCRIFSAICMQARVQLRQLHRFRTTHFLDFNTLRGYPSLLMSFVFISVKEKNAWNLHGSKEALHNVLLFLSVLSPQAIIIEQLSFESESWWEMVNVGRGKFCWNLIIAL